MASPVSMTLRYTSLFAWEPSAPINTIRTGLNALFGTHTPRGYGNSPPPQFTRPLTVAPPPVTDKFQYWPRF
jgi:hypothetical protein